MPGPKPTGGAPRGTIDLGGILMASASNIITGLTIKGLTKIFSKEEILKLLEENFKTEMESLERLIIPMIQGDIAITATFKAKFNEIFEALKKSILEQYQEPPAKIIT